MRRILLILLALSPAFPATAQEQAANAAPSEALAEATEVAQEAAPRVLDAAETTLEEWLWIKRPVVVFADSPADPRLAEQITLLTDRYDALAERDVVIITDSDPAALSPIRKALRPRGFALVVIAKDGTIVTRKPRPWSVREISRSIDKLPLRQEEIKGF